jgi:hypothetical protein
MGVMDNLTGNIQSAQIIVHDYRGMLEDSELSSMTVEGKLQGLTDEVALEKASKKTFRVQFNPSEIQIYTMSDPHSKMDVQTKKSLTASIQGPTAELSTTLYFDHMIVNDSFMLDKPILPFSVSGATNAVMAIGGKLEDHTVQKEVEGLLAALQNPLTRSVTFKWTDLTFTGTLYNINAQYTMFSNHGRPVRAKVNVRLRQQITEGTMAPWLSDFEKAFGGDSTNLVRPEQKFGNLLNLGL